MAERRMFSKRITSSDTFVDMPLSTQALYFHLSMSADDDGFVNNPRQIQRAVGATVDDLRLLASKGFIIAFDSGVIVVTHWKINNYIAKDRYHETIHQAEYSLLVKNDNGQYEQSDNGITESVSVLYTDCVQDVHEMDTQYRLDKTRIDKVSVGKGSARGKPGKFTPPSLDDVRAYCDERRNNVDPERFCNFYASKGWLVGKSPMKDWKAAVRNWEKDNRQTAVNDPHGVEKDYSGAPTAEEWFKYAEGLKFEEEKTRRLSL